MCVESPSGSAATLSSAQRQILIAVKRLGEASADDVAETVGITASAVRQHLATLRTGGYVAARQERGRPGRPADLYHSTELGESLFAGSGSSDFSVELLSLLEDEDPELVTRVFDRRRQRRVNQCQEQIAGKPLDEAVVHLAAVLDAEGYMAHVDKFPGGFRLTLHSCPMWSVASHYGQACTTELEFMRELLPGALVKRVIHKAAGAYVCSYEISELGPEPASTCSLSVNSVRRIRRAFASELRSPPPGDPDCWRSG
jgi:predicted ArsR family transcriptional regulator